MPRGGAIHSGLGPPHQSLTEENASQGYPRAVPQLRSLVPDGSSLSGGQKPKQRLKLRLSQALLQGSLLPKAGLSPKKAPLVDFLRVVMLVAGRGCMPSLT